MAKLVIVYGTGEGQTAKIAQYIANVARNHDQTVEVYHVHALPAGFSLQAFDAAIVGASIHDGQYPGAILDFVTAHRAYLADTPSAFFTVCLTATQNTEAAGGQAQQYVHTFEQATGWQATRAGIFAGALRYSQYGLIQRARAKRVARRHGQDTDTSRDWEYTDWQAVTRFAAGVVDAAMGP